jgi:hypothetical protein
MPTDTATTGLTGLPSVPEKMLPRNAATRRSETTPVMSKITPARTRRAIVFRTPTS